MKKLFTLLFALIIIVSIPMEASAATNGDYFHLFTGSNRLDGEGKFTFFLRSNTRSDRNFKTISNSISLTASAQVYSDNPSVNSPFNDDNVFFTIYLYKVGTSKPVGHFTQAANGKVGSTTFPVSTGAEYYFTVEISGSLGDWERVKGSGDFSNIYII